MGQRDQYFRRALKQLGLGQKKDAPHLRLGHFKIVENDSILDTAVAERVRFVAQERRGLLAEAHEKREHKEYQEHKQELDEIYRLWGRRSLLRFPEYERYSKNVSALESKFRTDHRSSDVVKDEAEWRFTKLYRSSRHMPDRAGYRNYLHDASRLKWDPERDPEKPLSFHKEVLDVRLKAYVPAGNHTEHTYIVGTTKIGKTELLKAYIYELMKTDATSIVFIAPDGDAAKQIARWKELEQSKRLIYVEPYLDERYTPTINPFDSEGVSDRNKIVLAQEIVSALAQILGGDIQSTLSHNMRALLSISVRLLLDLPGTTLRDLEDLMNNEPGLMKAGEQSHRTDIANFFARDFQKPSYGRTKDAISTKLASLLNTGVLEQLTCGRTTINLEDALANKKVVIFNLAKGDIGEEEGSAFGKLMMALVQGIGMRRARIPKSQRPMTHCIVDECQNYVSPSIATMIEETRKYGLALTLAQLAVGRNMSDDIRKVVSSIPNTYMVGRARSSGARDSAVLVGSDSSEIMRLGRGEFIYKTGTLPPFRMHVRSDLIDFKNSVDRETWKQTRTLQLATYYRLVAPPSPSRGEAAASAGSPTPAAGRVRKKKKLV